MFAIQTRGEGCRLQGRPAVRLLDAAGRVLPARVRTSGLGLPDEPLRTLTVGRGSSVSFLVATPDGGACEQAATLVAALPRVPGSMRATTSMRVCDRVVAVTPVRLLRGVD